MFDKGLTRRQRQGQQAVVRAFVALHHFEGEEVFYPMLWISKIKPAEIVPTRLGTISIVLLEVMVCDHPKLMLTAKVQLRARAKLDQPNGEKWIERFSHIEAVLLYREGEKDPFITVNFDEDGAVHAPGAPIAYMMWLEEHVRQ